MHPAAMPRARVPGEEARYWDGVAREWGECAPDGLWRAHTDAIHAALLRRWLPAAPVPRLLKTDLFDEAATGGLAALLRRHARSPLGADLSAATAGAARARCPGLSTAAMDVRRLPLADGCLDVVVSNSTLDHFAHPAEIGVALRELHRVLRPGGELLLTLDNPANPLVALRNALPFPWLRRAGLVPYYVGATLPAPRAAALLREVGFEVMEAGAILHCPRAPAVWAARLVARVGSAAARARLLRLLRAWEALGRLPTRFRTGCFIALRARKVPR